MSRKVTVFSIAIPQPQTVSSYFVYIPRILTSPFIVEAATFPSEVMDEVAVSFRGQEVYLPTKRRVPGTWTCTLSENIAMATMSQVNSLDTYIQRLNILNNSLKEIQDYNPVDIIIAPAAFSTNIPIPWAIRTLKNAWIKSIEPIQFSADSPTTPVKWKVEFRYNYIKTLI